MFLFTLHICTWVSVQMAGQDVPQVFKKKKNHRQTNVVYSPVAMVQTFPVNLRRRKQCEGSPWSQPPLFAQTGSSLLARTHTETIKLGLHVHTTRKRRSLSPQRVGGGSSDTSKLGSTTREHLRIKGQFISYSYSETNCKLGRGRQWCRD